MRPMIYEIQRAVCQQFGVSRTELVSEDRHRRLTRPRQIAMYLAREMTAHSYSEIGRRFGMRDHSTVIHGVRNINDLIDVYPEVAQDVISARWRVGQIVSARVNTLSQAA